MLAIANEYDWPDAGELMPLDDWHIVQQVEMVVRPFVVTRAQRRNRYSSVLCPDRTPSVPTPGSAFAGGDVQIRMIERQPLPEKERHARRVRHAAGQCQGRYTGRPMPPKPASRSALFYHALALAACLIWSFSYVHLVWLSEYLGPGQVAALRLDFFALALAAVWLWRRPRVRGYTARQWLLFAAIGLVGGPGYHVTLAWGAADGRTEASLIGLIIATVPLHVGWIAWLALGERLTARRMAGLLLGFTGIVLVVAGRHGGLTLGQTAVIGPALVTAATVFTASNTVMARGARRVINPLDLLALSGLFTVAGALVFQPFVDMPAVLDMPWMGWWAGFYLGVVAIAVAYFLWYSAVSGLPAVSVAMYLFLTSALSAVWARFWQEDALGWPYLVGSALVLVGLLIESARRFPQPTQTAATPLSPQCLSED